MDRDLLWDALMKELNDGGEFEVQPASQWSDESESASASPSTQVGSQDEDMSPATQGPSRSQATEHLPFSQSQKPSATFKEMGARRRVSPTKKDKTNLRQNLLYSQHAQRASQMPASQRAHHERQDHANSAVSQMAASQRPRTQASAMVMSSMASSAAKYVCSSLFPMPRPRLTTKAVTIPRCRAIAGIRPQSCTVVQPVGCGGYLQMHRRCARLARRRAY